MDIDYSKIIEAVTKTKSVDFNRLDIDLTTEQIEHYEYVKELIKPMIASSIVAAIEEYHHQIND